jgi:hypothetical protein
MNIIHSLYIIIFCLLIALKHTLFMKPIVIHTYIRQINLPILLINSKKYNMQITSPTWVLSSNKQGQLQLQKQFILN